MYSQLLYIVGSFEAPLHTVSSLIKLFYTEHVLQMQLKNFIQN